MGAQVAYSYPAPKVSPSIPTPAKTPRVHAVAGHKSQATPSIKPSSIVAAFAAVLVVFAFIGCMRVFFTSQAVLTLKQTSQLEASLQTARSVGAELEVDRSMLSNPERIGSQAKNLGMVIPDEIGTIVMEQDVVVLDEAGSLSLSESLVSAVELGAQS